jgi:hypothetical protein
VLSMQGQPGRVDGLRHGRRGGNCSRSPRACARGFYGSSGRGCRCYLEPAVPASAAEDGTPVRHCLCHKSPRREPGDCDVPHQLNRARLKRCCLCKGSPGGLTGCGMAGGVAIVPAVPLFPQSPCSRSPLVPAVPLFPQSPCSRSPLVPAVPLFPQSPGSRPGLLCGACMRGVYAGRVCGACMRVG